MKKLLTICAILIASISYSQDIIQITPEQAKQAIKNAQRVQVLEVAVRQQGIAISEFKLQVSDLKEQIEATEQQLDLWKKNYDLLNKQFEAEKAIKPKDKTLTWILRCIAIGAVSFAVGVVAY